MAANTAPVSVAMAKHLLWERLTASVPEMLAKEAEVFDWVRKQPDARKGVLSFIEKRPPQWSLGSKDVPEELFR